MLAATRAAGAEGRAPGGWSSPWLAHTPTSLGSLARMILDEAEELLVFGEQPAVLSIVLHSFISGQPWRLRALSEALARLTALGDT